MALPTKASARGEMSAAEKVVVVMASASARTSSKAARSSGWVSALRLRITRICSSMRRVKSGLSPSSIPDVRREEAVRGLDPPLYIIYFLLCEDALW